MTDMKEKIDLTQYAGQITAMLPKGILLNTKGDQFDTMVIGWGALGFNWGVPCFTAYVRQSRYTLQQLKINPDFTVSVPLDGPVSGITRICGQLSGRDTDKVKKAGLTLEEAEVNGVPGIREYPLTLECRSLYSLDMGTEALPEELRERWYPADSTGDRNPHTMFIGQIVDAYIIR